ncbi:MAG: TonB-dependent receptor plug domain-containing protein, partial [Myxococcales bacterium]|nr:TonB-dependent receptor plug domain-containing protein [Myxococcales bacterium]
MRLSALLGLLALLFAAPVSAQVDDPAEQDRDSIVEEATAADEPTDEEIGGFGVDEIEEEVVEPAAPGKGKAEGVEEIRVTATMSELTSADEAVSVTQFSAADIQDFRIQDISDLSDYTPNLEINTAFAASNPTVFIRGIGLKDYNANSAGSVAIYTDGIYVNSPAGQLFQLFDVANIEVLRGPQGSQSSRNATAGAIKVYSNKPDGEFSSAASLSYGHYNLMEFEGAVGFPVFGDTVSARISGAANFMDGYTKNKCQGALQDQTNGTDIFCDYLNRFWIGS